jgi:FkbM family methyltransferase
MHTAHYRFTQLIIEMGPDNPFVRAIMRFRCRRASLKFSDGKVDISIGNRTIRIAGKHFPYAADMTASFDIYFSQVTSENEGMSQVVDYSGPKLQHYPNGLAFEIASMPEESEALGSYLHWYRPKAGDTVFDMGAYCGVSTHFFSKCVGPTGKVFAFEPDPINYQLLQKNIARHALDNVVTLPFAVAGKSALAQFSSEGTMGSTLQRHSSRATLGSIAMVETISLENACANYGVPTFIKIDIEGSEIEMLSASRSFLCENDIQFALDTHHWMNGKLTNTRVEQIFIQCGYESESSDESGCMTTWARRRLSSQERMDTVGAGLPFNRT